MAKGLNAIVWTTPQEFPGKPCGHDHPVHTDAAECGKEMLRTVEDRRGYPSDGAGYMVVEDLGITSPEACLRLASAALAAGDLWDMLREITRMPLVRFRQEGKSKSE